MAEDETVPRRGEMPMFFGKEENKEEEKARISDRKRRQLEKDVIKLQAIKKVEDEIRELKRKREWLKKNWSIKYYQVLPDGSSKGPHSKQVAFHQDKRQIRIVSGANRSGKTTSNMAEVVSTCLGYRPWLDKEDPNYKTDMKVPLKCLIVGESYQVQVKEVIIPKLIGNPETGIPGLIPTMEIRDFKRNPQGVITKIRLKNFSQIFLQSYDQEFDLFESADYSLASFDEPPPRPIWIAVQRGLTDRVGKTIISMTPTKEAWIYDELYSREDVGLHYFDITDNLHYGLTQEGIDQFSRTLDEDAKEARLHGRYFHLVGLVYKKFSLDIHLKSRERVFQVNQGKVPRHWATWMHIDTHPRTPHHAVWITVSPNQRKFVCGALKNSDPLNRVDPFCEAMKVYEDKILGLRRFDEIARLIDPSAQINDPGRDDGKSMADLFRDKGFPCVPGSKNRDAAILLAQNSLDYNLEAGQFPNLFVMDDLPGVIYQFKHYQWDDHPIRTQQKHDLKQVPIKKDDHYIEGIHRILLDDPRCDPQGLERVPEREPVPMTGTGWTGY